MKKLFILFICILLTSCSVYEYKVEIIYCDGSRSPIIVTANDFHDPIIWTHKEAVPIVHLGGKKYLNVCETNILSKKEIE